MILVGLKRSTSLYDAQANDAMKLYCFRILLERLEDLFGAPSDLFDTSSDLPEPPSDLPMALSDAIPIRWTNKTEAIFKDGYLSFFANHFLA